MDTLQTAKFWQSLGIAAIPIAYKDKRPLVKWQPYQSSLPTEQELKQWFSRTCNIAVITGWKGLTVIDFDTLERFISWRIWATNTKGGIAGHVATKGYHISTGRTIGAVHVYIRLENATKTRPLLYADGTRSGIDIKSMGGYVLTAPSVHPSGSVYRHPKDAAFPDYVGALSKVLPPDLLTLPVNVPYQDRGLNIPQPKVWSNDPWTVAEQASIDSDVVDAIRARFDIADRFTQTWQSGDGWLMTHCPFHNDTTPSMWIDARPGRQVCGCYAGCTPKPLDVINLYARLHDLSNNDAINELARMLG